MRIFRIWTQERCSYSHGGVQFEGGVFGGSNESVEAAREDARRRWTGVCERIAGAGVRRPADYEADIREEVLRSVDGEAVVTRNRYGAEILNCPQTVIVDIDHAPRGILSLFFKSKSIGKIRDRAAARLKSAIETRKLGISGARVYFTPNGVRAILRTTATDPRSEEIQTLMRWLGVDRLYAALCKRQGCYRARLTPKPGRIGLKSLRQAWPLSEEQLAARADWVALYDAKRVEFSACQFQTTFGDPPSSPVVTLHDELSGALRSLPIA